MEDGLGHVVVPEMILGVNNFGNMFKRRRIRDVKSIYKPGDKVNWNLWIRMYNSNKMTSTIKLAHWNGGSSYLGVRNLGKAKLENIKFLLSKHLLDILGVSEANIDRRT